jgi:hypothetical protein
MVKKEGEFLPPLEGSGTKIARQMMEHLVRGSRLRALNRLLEYALAESEELGLAQLDKLLGAAAQAVSDELDDMSVWLLHTANDTSRTRH